MPEIIPNFLVAGASKAGTEWLRLALREHPDIHVPSGGHTLDFFSRRFDNGTDWYRAQFEERGDASVVGEKSSSYIISEEAPQRIAAYNPDMKLVFVLRQPIDRAYSHYCMWLRGGLVTNNVDSELNEQSPLVVEGRYHDHMQRFLQHFDRRQIRIMLYDDLRADPKTFLASIYSFLNVDSEFCPAVLEQRYHATKNRPRVQWLYSGAVKLMRSIRRSSRLGDQFVEAMRRKGYVDAFHRVNKGDDFPKLPEETRMRLAAYYHDDVEALGQLLERDLSHWLAGSIDPEIAAAEIDPG